MTADIVEVDLAEPQESTPCLPGRRHDFINGGRNGSWQSGFYQSSKSCSGWKGYVCTHCKTTVTVGAARLRPTRTPAPPHDLPRKFGDVPASFSLRLAPEWGSHATATQTKAVGELQTAMIRTAARAH